MLHYETIKPETLDLLKKIQQLSEFSGTRLVGGTALAMQLGHRVSIDLDIFGEMDTVTEDMGAIMKQVGEEKVISHGRNINIFLIDGVKVDIVNYPYGWIDEAVIENGIRLASLNDIAAMKIAAICNRGTKKDFIDIYFLLQKYRLREIIDLYLRKYTDGSEFIAIKSLTYFEDAEDDPMPLMLSDVSWAAVKEDISKAIKQIV